MTVKACLKSMRLRTLPLSLSGVIIGISLAASWHGVNAPTVYFLLLTTAFLQILSNLSNELGDTLQGTDGSDRQGMHYAVQDGEMTVEQLKILIGNIILCCIVCGLLMIYFSFGSLTGLQPLIFILLGAAAIVAAMKYTLGKNPYGYRAKGDIFVFIFFGLVNTLGAYYLCCHSLDLYKALLPACAVGCLSIGVLNINNIRDMKSDSRTRTTVALKLGLNNARIYETFLICSGWMFLTIYSVLNSSDWNGWLYFITLPLFALVIRNVWKKQDRALDPVLPLLVLSTFLMSVLLSVGIIW